MTQPIKFSSQKLAELLNEGKQDNVLVPNAAERYTPFPMTDLQQAYWIGRSSELQGGTSMQMYMELACLDFDLQRFSNAMNALVQRHDMLRCILVADNLQQVIDPAPQMPIKQEDLTHLPAQEQQARLDAIAKEMQTHTAELTKWPQSEVRFSFTKGTTQGHLHFKWDMWCFDGRSFQIIIEDLAALYQNPQASLPPLNLQFRDYVLALEEHEKGDKYAEDLAYWQQRLETLPPPPALPRAAGQKNTGQSGSTGFQTLSANISQETTEKFRANCIRHGLSTASAMAAAFSEVLRLWSGMRHFTLNCPRFNRNLDWHPDVTNIVGEFASFSLIEVNLDSGSTFLERAQSLQRQMWLDLDHASVSGLRLLRRRAQMKGAIELQAMPVVYTTMPDRRSADNTFEQALAALGTLVRTKGETPQVQLDCQYFVLNSGMRLNWDTQAEDFPAKVTQSMFDEFIRIVTQLGEDHESWNIRQAAGIPLAQLRQRDADNNIVLPLPESTAFAMFAAQAQATPDAPAVISEEKTVSYQELLVLAMRIGQSIIARSANAEKNEPSLTPSVAVLLKRGWKQIAAVLGIHAAGLAYLPLDPATPSARLATILETGKPYLVISEEDFNQDQNTAAVPFVTLAALLEQTAGTDQLPGNNTMRDSGLPGPLHDSPAYFMFTSGTTGIPKGVTVSNKSLLNLVLYTNKRFHIGPDDRLIGITSLHHDLSVYDIFGALASGAALVTLTHEKALDPAHWEELVRKENITLWNSVPMLLEHLLEQCNGQAPLQSMRTVILGGDWLNPTLPGRLREAAPNAALISIGGPTETTVWNIMFDTSRLAGPEENPGAQAIPGEVSNTEEGTADPIMDSQSTDAARGWQSIPYGKPIANASYYILNEALQDVPDWVTGEMYCGGVPLCLSCSTDPEQNRQGFAVHPRTGERIYRTGDLGRYHPDGLIEIIGRKDFQINLNGFRLDPAEVENELAQYSHIERAIVHIVGHDEKGEKAVLGASIIPSSDKLNIRDLRSWLFSRLPLQMHPKAFFILEQFPLTANGKLNRKQLQQMPLEQAAAAPDTQRDPENALETLVRDIWNEVLKTEVPGVSSNFFELGGNSLKALQVLTRIEKELYIRLPLPAFFSSPTVAELAEDILSSLADSPSNLGAETNTSIGQA